MISFDVQRSDVIIIKGDEENTYLNKRAKFLEDFGIEIPSNLVTCCYQPDKNIYTVTYLKSKTQGFSDPQDETFLKTIDDQIANIETRMQELIGVEL
jgi:hypothetical protein